ncbi:MAG: hypothetical protein R2991_09785 [Thermoanaerobaculia bacterium]
MRTLIEVVEVSVASRKDAVTSGFDSAPSSTTATKVMKSGWDTSSCQVPPARPVTVARPFPSVATGAGPVARASLR